MPKRLKITGSDRTQLMMETALVFGMTSLSGGFYLLGDLSKRFSKVGYAIGAQLDLYSLELLEFTATSLENCVWKEFSEN